MLGVESGVIGWDVGGVHTKAARVRLGAVAAAGARAYELQLAPDALPALLRELAEQVGALPSDRHAVTMTAELSQQFRTKRQGVGWVLDGFRAAFGSADVHVATVGGRWLTPDAAREAWRDVAAANWAVTAREVGRHHSDLLLIDIGSTTTDIIPIVGGQPVAAGRDDPGRLAAHELVYTGVVRTPVEALVSQVPYLTSLAGISAEGFALIGDVHVWRGALLPDGYDTRTPDGRPATRSCCGERLARLLCADRTMLDDSHLDVIAAYIADVQLQRLVHAIRCVRRRHPALRHAIAVGQGAWLALEAAEAAGLVAVAPVAALAATHAVAPAVCAALLLERTG